MSSLLQFRRNVTAVLASLTPDLAEIFYDTQKKTLLVGDGATMGGFPLARASDIQTGALTTQPAAGTVNALTATFPTVNATAYVNGQPFTLISSGPNTGNASAVITLGTTAQASLPILKAGSTQLQPGDTGPAGYPIQLFYSSTLGALIMTNPVSGITTVGGQVQGSFKNLTISATGTNSTVTVAADQVAVGSAAGAFLTLNAVALAINSAAAVGANGLDTGTLAASTWYSVWTIYNPATGTAAGLLSLSFTAPTMPSGYTFKARVGAIRTDATANKYPLSFLQKGRRAQYVMATGTNFATLPLLVNGVSGNPTTPPTFTAVSVIAVVPPTASRISIIWSNGASAIYIAPNNSYSGMNSNNVPPVACNMTQSLTGLIDMELESTNIYVASSSANSGYIGCGCIGWEDNL